MTVFVALLRAVNVGGTGKLAMKDLVALCEAQGFQNPRTYIQSGNVVFESERSEPSVKTALEDALGDHMGRKVDVMIRKAGAICAVLDRNPFPKADSAKVMVLFADARLPNAVLEGVRAPGGEQLHMGERELYVHYPNGMGRSKFALPALKAPVTARNLNTVRKLCEMAKG